MTSAAKQRKYQIDTYILIYVRIYMFRVCKTSVYLENIFYKTKQEN